MLINYSDLKSIASVIEDGLSRGRRDACGQSHAADQPVRRLDRNKRAFPVLARDSVHLRPESPFRMGRITQLTNHSSNTSAAAAVGATINGDELWRGSGWPFLLSRTVVSTSPK